MIEIKAISELRQCHTCMSLDDCKGVNFVRILPHLTQATEIILCKKCREELIEVLKQESK